jgi:hypothetical protein
MTGDPWDTIKDLSKAARACGILAVLGVATVERLAEVTGESVEDIETARKYYGKESDGAEHESAEEPYGSASGT